MRAWLDVLVLPWIFLKVRWFFFQQRRHVLRLYPHFAQYDRVFERNYLGRNPFSIAKAFFKQRGEQDIYNYGETPLTVFAHIAQESHLSSTDRILDLGCGRGKGVFFLSHLLQCVVVGVDWIPCFIEQAQRSAEEMRPRLQVAFCCAEFSTVDLSSFTVIYLYGTGLTDACIETLVERFEQLAPHVKIFTVSYPLIDYSCKFKTVQSWLVQFPWGQAELYLNQLHSS